MRLICLIIFLLFASIISECQNPSKQDTSVCNLYLCLNSEAAVNYTFHLYLNGKFITDIQNATRMIYKLHSTGQVTISDKNHKPIAAFEAKHGSEYYFRITKKFGGRYFNLIQYKTESEVQDYLHFVFWEKFEKEIGPTWGEILGSETTDHGSTKIIEENINDPVCKKVSE